MYKFNPFLIGNFDEVNDPLTNPIQFVGSITTSDDFPIKSEVENGWLYILTADVTDNYNAVNSLVFDGDSSDSVVFNNNLPYVDNGADWQMFFRCDSLPGVSTKIAQYQASSSNVNNRVEIWLNGTTLTTRLYYGGTNLRTVNTTISQGTWFSVGLTNDSDTYSYIVINGVKNNGGRTYNSCNMSYLKIFGDFIGCVDRIITTDTVLSTADRLAFFTETREPYDTVIDSGVITNYVFNNGITSPEWIARVGTASATITGTFSADTIEQAVRTESGVSLTNTLQEFQSKDEIVWNGTDWTVLGNTKDVDYLSFDTSYSPTGSEAIGTVFWNSTKGTLSVRTGEDSYLDIGQEDRYYVKAQGAISNGDVVQFAGWQGDHFTAKVAVPAEIIAYPRLIMGIATEDIANGSYGNIVARGEVTMNTTGFSVDHILYWDNSTGQLTNVMPNAPDRYIEMAAVIKEETSPAAANGILLVRISWGTKLTELEDVNGTPLTDSGQMPIWDNDNQYFDFTYNPLVTKDPTGFDRETASSLPVLSFVDNTQTLTLTPQGDNYYYYVRGKKIVHTEADSVSIGDIEGIWFIYYEDDVLTASQTPWDFDKVFVAIVYWDADGDMGVVGDELHGLMPHQVHGYLHNTSGAIYVSGFTPSLSVDDTTPDEESIKITSISAGRFYDEDIQHDNAEQTTYEVWWKDGANGDWRWTDATAYFVVGGTYPYYNEWTGTVWKRTEIAANKYGLMHAFGSNRYSTNNKVILVMGENQYNSKSDAEAGAKTEILNITTTTLPTPEFIELFTIVYQTSASYTNTLKAKAISTDGGAFIDFRTNDKIGVGAPISDHGNLSGLLDDDHTQYSLVDGTRDFTGDITSPNYNNVHEYNSTVDTSLTTQYFRIGRIPVETEQKDAIVKIRAVSSSGVVSTSMIFINIAYDSNLPASPVASITTQNAHSYNSNSTSDNGYVINTARISADSNYWYLDIQKYTPNAINVQVTPQASNEWEWFTGDLSTSVSAGSYSRSSSLAQGFRGDNVYANSAGSATYSQYMGNGGYTKSDANDKTGQWMYFGYFTQSYSSSYLDGHSANFIIWLSENSRNIKEASELEYIRLDVALQLDAFANSTEFNTTVPTMDIKVYGNTTLTGDDFAVLCYSTSTSSKVFRFYVKLKDADTNYSIMAIDRYGRRYTTTGGQATDGGFVYASNRGVITSLPTPALGSVTYGVKIEYVPYTGATSSVNIGGHNLTVGETNGDAGNIYVHLGDSGGGEYNTRISGGELYMEAEGSTLTINPYATDGYFNNHFTFFGENYASIGTYNLLTLTGSPIKFVGDVQQLSDSNKVYFGAGNDVSIFFDGSDLIFKSNNVTANDEVHFTNFDRYDFDAPVKLKGYTVATLPTGSQGDTAFVTDATSPTYLGTLTGGGAVVCPVFFDGTNWVSH